MAGRFRSLPVELSTLFRYQTRMEEEKGGCIYKNKSFLWTYRPKTAHLSVAVLGVRFFAAARRSSSGRVPARLGRAGYCGKCCATCSDSLPLPVGARTRGSGLRNRSRTNAQPAGDFLPRIEIPKSKRHV